jgi:hypothetical protein
VSATWGILLVSGFYPLYRAWRGTAGTTLRHAVVWACLAWGAWCAAILADSNPGLRYLALCLTACAGVAVLGARRPGVAAWDLVVACLLIALCRPLLEGLGELRLNRGHLFFLAVALSAALGNYLPTRQALTALVLGAWCVLQLAEVEAPWTVLVLVTVPWLGLLASPRNPSEDFDEIWRAYRDSFGFVWAQRLREQFNHSARNAGWAVYLGWSGLQLTGEGAPPDAAKLQETLWALLKRFRSEPS